jgi:DNA-binding XRE family transcriptional regulator
MKLPYDAEQIEEFKDAYINRGLSREIAAYSVGIKPHSAKTIIKKEGIVKRHKCYPNLSHLDLQRILELSQTMTVTDIAKKLGVHETTARNCIAAAELATRDMPEDLVEIFFDMPIEELEKRVSEYANR